MVTSDPDFRYKVKILSYLYKGYYISSTTIKILSYPEVTCVITIRRRPLFPVYYIEPCEQRYLDCTKVTIKPTILFCICHDYHKSYFLFLQLLLGFLFICCIFWLWLFVTHSLFCPVFLFLRKFVLFESILIDIYHVKHILKKITT